jgi:hypothetical protein
MRLKSSHPLPSHLAYVLYLETRRNEPDNSSETLTSSLIKVTPGNTSFRMGGGLKQSEVHDDHMDEVWSWTFLQWHL